MSEISSEKYPIHQVEKKWQAYWRDHKVFATDSSSARPPFYVLEMFPYPSGTLHMGHGRNYAIGDALARFRWSQGYEVLHPMGWDACGLPAENAALKHGINPKIWTYQNAAAMKVQCLSLGFSHDWDREIFSCDPNYYKHEQKMFLDFYANNLAYRKEAYVNWDPKEQSVLANEQVVDGRGWRSGALVEKRLLKQWFLKITDFAQELLDDLDTLNQWPEAVIAMQKNWIGQSRGLTLAFPLLAVPDQSDGKKALHIFTTRPETLFGASFCAIAWDHPLVQETTPEYRAGVDALVHECRQKGTSSRIMEVVAQKGALTGLFVAHPLKPGEKLPVVVANYVNSDYGTGAIFGCPGHDERDYALALSLNLPILYVIQDPTCLEYTGAYLGDGVMMHSGFLDGMTPEAARASVIDYCVERGIGQATTQYRLRDWGIGRQRYWGVPIPIIYCPDCGTLPVPEKDLPVVLPEDVRFDQAGNPLSNHPTWKNVSCPECGGAAQRETDTFDTFFESSWYFARFCDPHNSDHAFSPELAQHWLPVNQYVGGIEHAVMHLLYARFFTKALKKCGYWNISEPFKGLFTQGMVCHKTYQLADGTWILPEEADQYQAQGQVVTVGRSEKMSKSKCNVVGVTQMVETYGADAVRLFVLSDTPPQKDLEWTEEGIEGAWRYVRRIWSLFQEQKSLCLQVNWPTDVRGVFSKPAMTLRRFVHHSLGELHQAMDNYSLNKYVALLRQWSNEMADLPLGDKCAGGSGETERWENTPSDAWALRESWTYFIQALAPIMPHLAEEMGNHLGFTPGIHRMPWPQVDQSLLEEAQVSISVQVNGKHRGVVTVLRSATEADVVHAVRGQENLQKHIQGPWKRTIFVPGRMISIIIAPGGNP